MARSNQKQNRKPWGYVSAVIELPDDKTAIIPMGSVWETEKGNLRINLDSEPVQWRDPHARRILIISEREQGGDR